MKTVFSEEQFQNELAPMKVSFDPGANTTIAREAKLLKQFSPKLERRGIELTTWTRKMCFGRVVRYLMEVRIAIHRET
jgi:hypothetical protein